MDDMQLPHQEEFKIQQKTINAKIWKHSLLVAALFALFGVIILSDFTANIAETATNKNYFITIFIIFSGATLLFMGQQLRMIERLIKEKHLLLRQEVEQTMKHHASEILKMLNNEQL